jgi:hypothetical protein
MPFAMAPQIDIEDFVVESVVASEGFPVPLVVQDAVIRTAIEGK